MRLVQGCGIKWFIPTSVIQGNLLLIWGVSLWKDLFVVSQKWSFPTTLGWFEGKPNKIHAAGLLGLKFASHVPLPGVFNFNCGLTRVSSGNTPVAA